MIPGTDWGLKLFHSLAWMIGAGFEFLARALRQLLNNIYRQDALLVESER
jgi:hypothetical protein